MDTRLRNPSQIPHCRLFWSEIIHNPHVNAKLEAMGIVFLHSTGRTANSIFRG